jgi:hypothetical protein
MASISKFSTALLSVPNELTVAAANFNLNFSLMKVEAPVEFHGLRDALSTTRRQEAEEGLSHVTARYLGALFESVIPPSPLLTAAYGKRVSEISEQTKAIPQTAGMFADRAGADGTSIWAAATSGQHAIAMHLLACMLGRIWKPAEATSLWVELVERRKQEIFKAYNASTATGIPSIMAAQQLFNRQQLSAWDASARSWLQTADRVKRLAQTQLMLIINNIRLPVNSSKEPYESVVLAWTSGMNMVERLLDGVPQRVQDGAVLLAISSWHLYPNMQVLHDSTTEINPGDELMVQSILTISSHGGNDSKEGVFWSLPLSRMRYYSSAIMSERSFASDTARISMEEFQIVFLGAFIARWRGICSDELRWARLIVRLFEAFQNRKKTVPPWFQILAAAASLVTNSRGHLRAQLHKLVKLGSRRCQDFLHESQYKPPIFFGLEYFHILIRTLKNDEERIKLLRQATISRDPTGSEAMIRYTDGTFNYYATVYPTIRSSYKRTVTQEATPSTGYQRYAIGDTEPIQVSCHGSEVCGCMDPTAETCICQREGTRCTFICHPETGTCSGVDPPFPVDCYFPTPCTDTKCVVCRNESLVESLSQNGEEALLVHPYSVRSVDEFQFEFRKPGEAGMTTYGLFLGHGTIASVYKRKSHPTYDTYNQNVSDFPSATMDEIESIVESKFFDPSSLDLSTCCRHWDGKGAEQQMYSLSAPVFASKVYGSMPEATLSIEVINRPLYCSAWASSSIPEYLPQADLHERSMWWHRYENITNASHDGADRSQEMTHSPGIADLITPDADDGTEYTSLSRSPRSERDESCTIPDPGVVQGTNSVNGEKEGETTAEYELKKAFSCIAWFKSGEFDIPVSHFHAVMALANGGSIYVASVLLADPSVTSHSSPVRRVFGNLGRSEVCLLVPRQIHDSQSRTCDYGNRSIIWILMANWKTVSKEPHYI